MTYHTSPKPKKLLLFANCCFLRKRRKKKETNKIYKMVGQTTTLLFVMNDGDGNGDTGNWIFCGLLILLMAVLTVQYYSDFMERHVKQDRKIVIQNHILAAHSPFPTVCRAARYEVCRMSGTSGISYV